MSYVLVDEVLRHAPKELTSSERLVLVVIAEAVFNQDYERTGCRTTERTHAELAERAGLTIAAFRKAVYRLGKPQGDRDALEVRVGLGTDRFGHTQWAVTGLKPIFRVPDMPPPAGCTCSPCRRADLKVITGGAG